MLSEAFLIVKEIFRKKNPPRAVVLEIGPRDFIDNMTPDPNRSRLSQVLTKRQEPFNWRRDRTTSENIDMIAEKTSLFYSMRGELQHDQFDQALMPEEIRPEDIRASIYQATLHG